MRIYYEIFLLFPALIIQLTLFSSTMTTSKASRIQSEASEEDEDQLRPAPHPSSSPSSSPPLLPCPSSCFCDENSIYVSCVGDSVWDLGFPRIPSTVVRLEMRNYKVGILTPSHLEGMMELQELKLQQANIDSIANGTFMGINKLERLDLGDNLIENLTRQAFEGLQESLRYIDLSSNKLRNIEEAFVDLAAVEQLNLRKNRLSNLTTNTFRGLNRLQYLNLDSNQITFIELGSFIHLPNLAHLLISNNPLSSLSRLDSVTTRLQYIDVSNIGLTMVPQGIDPFVRDLRLAKNQIRRITSGDVDKYAYLSLLVLDDNQIEEIEQDALGRLEYLIRLWLNGNRLKKVPLTLPSSLRELYLEENLIEEVDQFSLRGLTNLERLFLRRNQIHLLEKDCFSDLQSLQHLDLQGNRLEKLTVGVFANLSRLERLDLSENQMKHLNGSAFQGLVNLKVLRLSGIGSTEIELDENLFEPLQSLESLEMCDSPTLVRRLLGSTKVLESLQNVQELNLMHNQLESLREDFSSYFPLLRTIKLGENSWHCDHSILWLLDWIKRAPSSLTFSMSYDLKCSSPSTLQFKPIRLLTRSDLLGTNSSMGTPPSKIVVSTSLSSSSFSDSSSTSSSSSPFIEAKTATSLLPSKDVPIRAITTKTRTTDHPFVPFSKDVFSSETKGSDKSDTMYSPPTTMNNQRAELSTETILDEGTTPRLQSPPLSRTFKFKEKDSFGRKNEQSYSKLEKLGLKSWNSTAFHNLFLGNNNNNLSQAYNDSGTAELSVDEMNYARRERKHIPKALKPKPSSVIPPSLEHIKDPTYQASHHRSKEPTNKPPSNVLLFSSIALLLVCAMITLLLYTLTKKKTHQSLNKFITEQWNRSLSRRRSRRRRIGCNSVSFVPQKDEVPITYISKSYRLDPNCETDFAFKNNLYFEMSDEDQLSGGSRS